MSVKKVYTKEKDGYVITAILGLDDNGDNGRLELYTSFGDIRSAGKTIQLGPDLEYGIYAFERIAKSWAEQEMERKMLMQQGWDAAPGILSRLGYK